MKPPSSPLSLAARLMTRAERVSAVAGNLGDVRLADSRLEKAVAHQTLMPGANACIAWLQSSRLVSISQIQHRAHHVEQEKRQARPVHPDTEAGDLVPSRRQEE